jgi:hypothetical protein
VIGCVCLVVGLYISEGKVQVYFLLISGNKLESEKHLQTKMDTVSVLTNERNALQLRLDSQAKSYTELDNVLNVAKVDFERIEVPCSQRIPNNHRSVLIYYLQI